MGIQSDYSYLYYLTIAVVFEIVYLKDCYTQYSTDNETKKTTFVYKAICYWLFVGGSIQISLGIFVLFITYTKSCFIKKISGGVCLNIKALKNCTTHYCTLGMQTWYIAQKDVRLRAGYRSQISQPYIYRIVSKTHVLITCFSLFPPNSWSGMIFLRGVLN